HVQGANEVHVGCNPIQLAGDGGRAKLDEVARRQVRPCPVVESVSGFQVGACARTKSLPVHLIGDHQLAPLLRSGPRGGTWTIDAVVPTSSGSEKNKGDWDSQA